MVCVVAVLAGCAGWSGGEPRPPLPGRPPLVETAPRPPPPPPPEGYAWDDLARRAADRSGEAGALLLDAQARRHQAAADTAWPDPQLRLAAGRGDADDVRRGLSPGERASRSSDAYQVGLRFPLAHPFVTPWLRRSGAATARAREAESPEIAGAVFHEVRALCLEAAALEAEIEWLRQMAELRTQLRDIRSRQAAAGLADALELIQSVTRAATLREDLRDRQEEHRQVLHRIARWTDVPGGQLRLRPLDAEPMPDLDAWPLEALIQRAFERRPDLARLRHEAEAAAHDLAAVRAAVLPWFDHVEGSYEDQTTRITSRGDGVPGSITDRAAAEWQLRVALSLPIWGGRGDRLHTARLRQAAADLRLQSLQEDLRADLTALHADARRARAEFDRLAAEHRQVRDLMESRLAGFADEPAVRQEDLLAAREAVAAYSRIRLRAERRVRLYFQQLETLCGDPLEAPAPRPDPPAPPAAPAPADEGPGRPVTR